MNTKPPGSRLHTAVVSYRLDWWCLAFAYEYIKCFFNFSNILPGMERGDGNTAAAHSAKQRQAYTYMPQQAVQAYTQAIPGTWYVVARLSRKAGARVVKRSTISIAARRVIVRGNVPRVCQTTSQSQCSTLVYKY